MGEKMDMKKARRHCRAFRNKNDLIYCQTDVYLTINFLVTK